MQTKVFVNDPAPRASGLRDAWLAVARRRISVCHRWEERSLHPTSRLDAGGRHLLTSLRPLLWAAGGEFASGLGGLRLSELGLLLNGGLRAAAWLECPRRPVDI